MSVDRRRVQVALMVQIYQRLVRTRAAETSHEWPTRPFALPHFGASQSSTEQLTAMLNNFVSLRLRK